MFIVDKPSLSLGQGTADWHQQLDGGSVRRHLMQADLSVKLNAAVLHRLLFSHTWAEDVLTPWHQTQPQALALVCSVAAAPSLGR